MSTSRRTYQNEILKRTEAALCGLIDESHAECLPEVVDYVKILKEYMNATKDGMMRYFEGNTYSTVTMDYNSDTQAIWNFLNAYVCKARILFVEKHNGYIQISYYWTADIKKSGSIRASIRRNSTGIIQDIPKHTLSFDERIITGHENGFKEFFDTFEQDKIAWSEMLKERKRMADAKRREAIAEQERQEKDAAAQKIQAEYDRQEARLFHAVEKRARRCGVAVPSFGTKKYLTPLSGFDVYEVNELLRRAKTNSSELNLRLQLIQAIANYTHFTKQSVYVEELEIMFGKIFEKIIGE